MPRSPLTDLINKVDSLIDEVHGLPEGGYDLFLDRLLPEVEVEKPKRGRKKKSASGRKPGLPQSQEAASSEASSDLRCDVCGNTADHSDHDSTYLSSHPFARTAGKKSSRKGAGQSSIPSTVGDVENASSVTA
jgi:hypothetical protein